MLIKKALLLAPLVAIVFAPVAPSLYQDLPGLALLAKSNFESGRADGWRPNDPAHWRVVSKDGAMVYELTAPGEPGKVRAPTSWSVWTDDDVTSFEFRGRIKCYTDPANNKRDMCVFFHFQDPTHFYYVHFAGSSDDVHNIIGLVNGADRVKVNAEPAGRSVFRMTDLEWHEFKVVCDGASGEVRAYLDDMTGPVLTARDTMLGHGMVGVGSFDDTGCFAGLQLWGAVKKK
jgi:hypothetical protein